MGEGNMNMSAIRLVKEEGASLYRASRPTISSFYFSPVEWGPLESFKLRVM